MKVSNALVVALLLIQSPPVIGKESDILKTSPDIANPAPKRDLLKAVGRYDRAIKRNPHDLLSYYYRARDLLDMRAYPSACAGFIKCLQVDPYKPGMSAQIVDKDEKLKTGKVIAAWCYQNLAYISFLKAEYQKGIDDITQAIAIRPAYAINFKNRCVAYRKLGKMDLAQRDFFRVRQLIRHPEHDDCTYLPTQ
jgi:tetratricopeptide (TPR) repeat protein